jgi:DNA replication regulator SLD3
MRSATVPALPVMPILKREASESTPIESGLSVNRGGVLKSKRFSQREVDLTTPINGEAKLKKQASIDAELKEAISALKKPNRQLAELSFVESAERRVSSGGKSLLHCFYIHANSTVNKSTKTSRGVQIFATPKSNRHKDVLADVPISRVPQSIERPAQSHDLLGMTGRSQPSAGISETPWRDVSERPIEIVGASPSSSPLFLRRSQPFAIPESAIKIEKTLEVEATPCKRTHDSNIFGGLMERSQASLNIQRNKGIAELGGVSDSKGFIDTGIIDTGFIDTGIIDTGITDTGIIDYTEDTIYKALGWDD